MSGLGSPSQEGGAPEWLELLEFKVMLTAVFHLAFQLLKGKYDAMVIKQCPRVGGGS